MQVPLNHRMWVQIPLGTPNTKKVRICVECAVFERLLRSVHLKKGSVNHGKELGTKKCLSYDKSITQKGKLCRRLK